ncbi:hypothetical protein [Streptomyces sp. NPDC018031]|uniref:hypothetical protein n=1 Tax=Streptomyces sp. NPDC018031 TaxID=3365033 RepID=UPI0037A61F71
MMSAADFDKQFREQANQQRQWGLRVLAAGAVLWGWFAYLVMFPYDIEHGSGPDIECDALLFGDGPTELCAEHRPWWEALAVLGVSIPVTILGAVLYVIAVASLNASRYRRDMAYFEAEATREEPHG